MTKDLPTYDQLPIDPKYPAKTAWGLWGEDDNLGTLNLLTKERVANASKCIIKGDVFPLNWNLEMPNPVLFGRSGGHHHVKPRRSDHKIFDDVYDNYNTQSSSQWDGLRHVCHFQSGLFYNGVKAQEILLDTPESSSRLGIHHAARRGIAGRGVLLDYGRWALKHRPEFDPFERIEITVQELEEVAKEQNVTFEHGDILLVRVGWMGAYLGYSEAQLKELIKDPENPVCAGVKACDETFEWIWNNHFAAVGSDNFPFEAYPPKDWNTSCHAMFLGGWGMPIGEMFFLEKLAEDCDKDKVYTFFFTSAPLNKEKGVASPPNALCIK